VNLTIHSNVQLDFVSADRELLGSEEINNYMWRANDRLQAAKYTAPSNSQSTDADGFDFVEQEVFLCNRPTEL